MINTNEIAAAIRTALEGVDYGDTIFPASTARVGSQEGFEFSFAGYTVVVEDDRVGVWADLSTIEDDDEPTQQEIDEGGYWVVCNSASKALDWVKGFAMGYTAPIEERK